MSESPSSAQAQDARACLWCGKAVPPDEEANGPLVCARCRRLLSDANISEEEINGGPKRVPDVPASG